MSRTQPPAAQAARGASTDAIHNPVSREHTGRENHSADQALRDLPAIDALEERDDEIVIADPILAAKDYVEELKFNEDFLTIFLHRGREKFAPQLLDFYVNGLVCWIPVEQRVRVRRKFVEVMARSQPMDVRTESHMIESSQEAATINRIHRSLSINYSFSVIHDPSPKGAEWLAKIMREA